MCVLLHIISTKICQLTKFWAKRKKSINIGMEEQISKAMLRYKICFYVPSLLKHLHEPHCPECTGKGMPKWTLISSEVSGASYNLRVISLGASGLCPENNENQTKPDLLGQGLFAGLQACSTHEGHKV